MHHDAENLSIFGAFVRAAHLAVEPGSIRAEDPKQQKPDVSCMLDGRRHYFELTRGTNEVNAEMLGQTRLKARSSGKGAVGRVVTSEPGTAFTNAVQRKAGKSYRVARHPIDLLIWLDRRTDPLAAAPVTEPFRVSSLHSAVGRHQRRWHWVWLFDPLTEQVVCSIDGASGMCERHNNQLQRTRSATAGQRGPRR